MLCHALAWQNVANQKFEYNPSDTSIGAVMGRPLDTSSFRVEGFVRNASASIICKEKKIQIKPRFTK